MFSRFATALSLLLQLFILSVSGLSSPPSGAITVGSGKDYTTLSAALKDTSGSVYFVYPGTYNEQVVIARSNVKIYGQTNTSGSYTGNTVTVTHGVPASTAGSNDASGTVQVHATNVALYNLNIANTYGDPVSQSQAIALSVQAGSFGAYGLKLTGYQDTLLADKGSQIYSNCWIEGAVDFIFGMQASIWITKSTINAVGTGFLTASGRSSNDTNWYVIDHSVVQGSGEVYLGRPWRDYARVVFQSTTLGSNVQPAGWSIWDVGNDQTDHVTFAEYQNTGPGASGTRANFSSKLSAPISITTVLNTTSWVDSTFL